MQFLVDILIDERIAQGVVTRAEFPSLAYAVQRMAGYGQSIWQEYASGKTLPNGKVIRARSGRYMRSILTRQTGDFSSEIYSDLLYAKDIEQGTPARDLKRMLDTSMKVRMSKKGKRYLIIPFRHGTPTNTPGSDGKNATGMNVMPESVFDAWKGMKKSRIVSVSRRASGNGSYDLRTRSPFMVAQRKYKWGDRMTGDQLRALGVSGRQLKHMKGMVHMQQRKGLGKKGGVHGQYLTFRVMSEDSTGWLVKARDGAWPAKTTAAELRPIAEKAFAGAVEADIRRLL